MYNKNDGTRKACATMKTDTITSNVCGGDKSDATVRKRIFCFDYLRVAAAAMVVMLHTITPALSSASLYGTTTFTCAVFLNSICRAGVPLFFMISGYLALTSPATDDIGRFYKKKAVRILVPLFVWNVIFFFFSNRNFFDTESFSVRTFLTQVINNGTFYHLWFLYTLFALYLFAPFIKKITDNCSDKKLFIFFIISIFPCTLRPFLNIVTPLYFNLFDVFTAGYGGFFIFGLLLSRIKLSRGARFAVYILGVLGLVMGAVGNIYFSSAEKINLVFNMGYSLNHYLTAGALFTFFWNIRFPENHGESSLYKCVSLLGGISFGVYLVHPMILELVTEKIEITGNFAVVGGARFILTLAVSSLVSIVIYKIKILRKFLM